MALRKQISCKDHKIFITKLNLINEETIENQPAKLSRDSLKQKALKLQCLMIHS